MSALVAKLFKKAEKKATRPDARRALPGDGSCYPIPYTGERLKVTNDLLSRCKILADYSGAFRMNEEVVLKTGEAVHMSEAASMRLIRERTSVPVPRVLDAYLQEDDDNKRGVILMEYIPGETLDKAWSMCDEEQKRSILSQLQRYLREIRGIKGDFIGSVDHEHCRDQFFTDDKKAFGPFPDELEFHRTLAEVLKERGDTSWQQMVARFIESLSGHETVMTHNDLAPRNILVRDGKVVALLDWELSGYYPDYWEYVKAYLWNDWQSPWISEALPDQILEPRLHELAYLLHARDICW